MSEQGAGRLGRRKVESLSGAQSQKYLPRCLLEAKFSIRQCMPIIGRRLTMPAAQPPSLVLQMITASAVRVVAASVAQAKANPVSVKSNFTVPSVGPRNGGGHDRPFGGWFQSGRIALRARSTMSFGVA